MTTVDAETRRPGGSRSSSDALTHKANQASGQHGGRDAYAFVGLATRETLRLARGERLSGSEWRILSGVLELTTSYSRLGDHFYTAQIAALTGIAPKRTRELLGALNRKGVIDYRPARGQGRKSWVALRRPDSKTPASGGLSDHSERPPDPVAFQAENSIGSVPERPPNREALPRSTPRRRQSTTTSSWG
jgi:hypothetical protein